ncbi:MAG: SIMPL domain-containing protein [Proteobacteria bacterium]|jgi:uncharacterized protein|nr:SIMPL domain-containing protein [Pseudomonadota bacterium]
MASNGFVSIPAAALLTVGLAVGGWFIGDGLLKARQTDRFVTVKGLSERIVKADVASWPLSFTVSSDDLGTAQQKIETQAILISSFLDSHGLSASTVIIDRLSVMDQRAQSYRSVPIEPGTRFVVSQTLVVRTGDVDKVTAASRSIGELVKQGVILTDASGPSYRFTGLNDIKPEMIAEATKSARSSAQQFTDDSGSTVGTIRRANQGVFDIMPRDSGEQWQEAQSIEKRVRVDR